MVDVFSKKKRSEVMSQIRGSGNLSTEKKLVSLFRKYKISGWRRHYPAFGKPDFALPAFGDAEALRAALLAQWADTPDLHPLAGKLAQLFEQIGVEIEQSSELSPFVYVMF